MKPLPAVAVALLIPAALTAHAKNKKPSVPAVFGQARYVYVEATDGKEFDPNLNPDDRIAIADVRDALGNWGRYVLTTSRDEADVVIVVRKGRAVGADVDITPHHGTLAGGPGQPPGMGEGVGLGAEAGPSDDLMEVCQVNSDGRLSGPLWEQSMPEGLRAPKITLLEQFEEAVDKAYPPHPAGTKAQTQQSSQQGTAQAQQPPSQKP